jgi:hypothetical protein
MRWLIAVAFALTLGLTNAVAQTSAVCGHYESAWAKVSGGSNAAAMSHVIDTIPDLCSDLKARAEQRRDDVEARSSQPAKVTKVAPVSPAAKLRAARADPDLKTGYEIMSWLCANIGPAGFDITKAYTSFPDDKLVLKDETRTPDKSQEHITVVHAATGPLYTVEYHNQVQTSDNSAYGYSIFITSVDAVTNPIFPNADAGNKWLATFGDPVAGVVGPEVGFGPRNTVMNQSPLSLAVWSGSFPIDVSWFSPAGLRYTNLMCKGA